MATAGTKELITDAIKRIQAEAPALQRLKLVFGLELRGRGDVQAFRVEVPGPTISKGFADDERVHVSLARSHFNELTTDGKLHHWQEAFEHGHIKASGDPNIQKLIAQVIERQLARGHLKKAH